MMMRERTGRITAASMVLSGSMLVACVGGGGALSDGLTTTDPAPGSVESAGNSREGAPGSREGAPSVRDNVGASAEPGPGAQGVGASGGGSGGFECSGAFVCQETGKKSTDAIILASVGGVCVLPASQGGGAVLEGDGKITLNGKAVGSWAPSGTGFTVTVDKSVIVCTRAQGS